MLINSIASSSRRIVPSTLLRQAALAPRPAQRFYASNVSPEAGREKAKDRAAVGPFNAKAAGLFVATGIGLFLYFRSEKQAVEERKRLETAQAKVGRPKIGGDFDMIMPAPESPSAPAINVKGRQFSASDLNGSFSLIYFGFCNCPDICVDILDIIGEVVNRVDSKHGPVINPVFVTCDPARDTLPALSVYTSEFHPRMVGLTGTYEAVKQACKAYRVYFSTPPGADPSSDYLVDHSVFVFLMDPDGKFIEAFGRSSGVEETTTKVLGFIDQWKAAGNSIQPANVKERILSDTSRVVESI
jgi:protein SCO1/2